MTAKQLSNRLRVSQPAVSQYEKNEVSGSITLTTLRNVADALECELVYALLPKRGLEETREAQARRVAERVVRSVAHSMNLERQIVSEEEVQQQIKDLVRQILDEKPRGLWNEP
jgi:predicted DNA-binding mobile mystery protein A